jgi:hypothetical protein
MGVYHFFSWLQPNVTFTFALCAISFVWGMDRGYGLFSVYREIPLWSIHSVLLELRRLRQDSYNSSSEVAL